MNPRMKILATACILGLAGLGAATLTAQVPSPQQTVDAAFNKFKSLQEGKNADYIPALAKVDPNLFGIALVRLMARSTRQAT
jgi:glutaminase